MPAAGHIRRDIAHFQKKSGLKIAGWLAGTIKLPFRKLNSLLHIPQMARMQ
jgi:hypothetical protein